MALRALSCGAEVNPHSCVVSMEIHVVPVAIVGTRETQGILPKREAEQHFSVWNNYNCPSFTSMSWSEHCSLIPGPFSFLYSLSNNFISDEGGRAVAEALRVNHTLTSLT